MEICLRNQWSSDQYDKSSLEGLKNSCCISNWRTCPSITIELFAPNLILPPMKVSTCVIKYNSWTREFSNKNAAKTNGNKTPYLVYIKDLLGVRYFLLCTQLIYQRFCPKVPSSFTQMTPYLSIISTLICILNQSTAIWNKS